MRLPAITATVVACLALAGCGAGEPEYEGVEPTVFAKATCTGWAAWQEPDDVLGDASLSLSATGAEQKTQVTKAVGDYEAMLVAARGDAAANVPAVKDGEAAVALFTDYYDERIGVIDERMAEFGDSPEELTANNDQIINESLDVMRCVMESGADALRLDYPFTQIEDQAIIKAFGDEPACSDLVRVFGG